MTAADDAIAIARQISDKVSNASPIPPDPDIARLCEPIATSENLDQIVKVLTQEARDRVDREPRQALGRARVAYALSASQQESVRAEAALTRAITSNMLGEFQDAFSSAGEAARLFCQCSDAEKAAQSICEAAWSNTFIGDLNQARKDVEQARATSSSPLLLARCDWIQARVLRNQSQYPKAIEFLEKALAVFQAVPVPLEAARCERELAYTRIFSQKGDALKPLERLRHWFEASGYRLDAANCDLAISSAYLENGLHVQAVEPDLAARRTFADFKSDFFVALCDRNLGIVHHYLNHYAESLQAAHRARDYFSAHGIKVEVSACDINLGATYYWLNRYDEALQMYQEAEDLIQGEGREARVARIYINMGLIYAKQGRLSQALDMQHRALEIAASKDLASLVAGCHGNLAICYRELGDYDQALRHEQQRKESLLKRQRRSPLVICNISMAEIYFAKGETSNAIDCLGEARSIAEADGLRMYIAVCDRLFVQAGAQTIDRKDLLARIGNARLLFLRQPQPVDAALCDLTQAELHLQWGEIPASQRYFRQAERILSPAIPDQAWRAEFGLGKCADAANKRASALEHYLRAVRTIAASRSALVTEQLSNDFFARRQTVYDDALTLALRQKNHKAAVEIIELSKARTFLTLLRDRGWKSHPADGDPYVADLIEREKQLRYQLTDLRERAMGKIRTEQEFRGGEELAARSAAARKEISAINQAYESVALQLRLAMTGLSGVSVPAPFALDQFCKAANSIFGENWAAIDYYLSDDELTIALVQPNELSVTRKHLSEYDRAILDRCVTTDPGVRELVYKGTLRGEVAPSPGREYLSHLYRLLIPEKLDAETLIIAPHRRLHVLPFHALMSGDQYLIERYTPVYAPSLQVLQVLCSEPVTKESRDSFVLGISNFGERMRALQSTKSEVEKVLALFGGNAKALWDDQATRKKLFELNASGELKKYDLLHFSSHAIQSDEAPHRSRVLLHDAELTTLDILDLTLNARLVTLSACETALGKGGRGDEALSLARSFFYAGARALLATLWPIEDETTLVNLIEEFYRRWSAGSDAAQSLRKTACEMIREGKPPCYWAPFVLIGRP